jgi:hypothetical protein
MNDLEKESSHLKHLMMILKYGHLYSEAPVGSEQFIAYSIGDDNCKKVLIMIDNIRKDELLCGNSITNPFKTFEYLDQLMKHTKDFSSFSDNTPEKVAYHMPEAIRQQVLVMIEIIKNFDPYK